MKGSEAIKKLLCPGCPDKQLKYCKRKGLYCGRIWTVLDYIRTCREELYPEYLEIQKPKTERGK